MNYIVLDLEWNQPVAANMVRHNLRGEIIQIGAVKLDENYQRLDGFDALVRPVFYTKMKGHVKRITGIDNQRLKMGEPFPQAAERFFDWCGEDYVFVTWGMDDLPMLRENMLLHSISDESLPICYNLQYIFNTQISGDNRQWSLQDAMEKLEIVNDLSAHDALNDAENTALICRALDTDKGIREYDPMKYRSQKAMNREVTFKGYRSREDAMEDMMLLSPVCPVCGLSIRCRGWLKKGNDRRIATGRCRLHGDYYVRIKFKKAERGFIAQRRVAPMNDELLTIYLKRLEETQDEDYFVN